MTPIDSSLIEAISRGASTSVCLDLIGNGADINGWDWKGLTMLQLAVKRQHLEICEALIQSGAQVNQKSFHKDTTLAFAINGDPAICQMLVNAQVDVNALDAYGQSALHDAVLMANAPGCLFLLEHGIDAELADAEQITALQLAQNLKHESCITILRSWRAAQAARSVMQEIMPDACETQVHHNGI